MEKKKVLYLTSSRADYGIVREYLKKLKEDNDIDLRLLVTGSILDMDKGFDMILKDNHTIEKKIPLILENDTNLDITNAMSYELKVFGDYFYHNKVDLLIVLGDRYEIFPCVIGAAMNRVRILHFHGGELTYGNYDEFIRHSITKMSHYHFTSTKEYRKRVIQMGEEPSTVFNIGALGCENCKNIYLSDVVDTIKGLDEKAYFVVLYHPETLTGNNDLKVVNNILKIVEMYSKYQFVFIGNNQDTNSSFIKKRFLEFVSKNNNTIYYENLNPDTYHYLLKNSIALIGNSSSGIIEAPILHTYTINIGNRQLGRTRPDSVIQVDGYFNDIKDAVEYVLTKPDICFDSPYYQENSVENAYKNTKLILNKKDNIKTFYDGSISYEK